MVGVLAVGMIALAGCGGEPAAPSSAAAGPASSAAAPAPTPASPTSAAPVATPAAAEVVAYTVAQPKTLLGRAPATEAGIKEQGAKVGNAWGAESGRTTVSGAYGTTGKKNVMLFAASTADIRDPSAFLDDVAAQGFAKYRFRPVDAGARGAGRCADATAGATPTTLCLWADEYATGIIYFFFGAAADADRLLPQARAEIEVDKNK
ncbi:hypothetical protein [Dactylosporangium sp. CA-139066]|uniref:hypothetical protein n=1 Tax=Dactylosporangium sp. CA-139066 TaxID=3239930 RepID=UPI003D94ACC3